MPRSGSLALALLAALPILAILASIVPGGADAVGEVGVSIIMDPLPAVCHVGPGSDRIVTLTGTIQATEPLDIQAQFAVIELSVDCGSWFVTDIAPIVLYSSSREARFSFSIQIPKGTPFETGSPQDRVFSVTGTWRYEPGSLSGPVQPADFIIDVEQYYLFSIKCRTPNISTSPGGEFDLDLEIENQGNGDDRIVIDILNKDMLLKEGWVVPYAQTAFDIAYAGTLPVKVKVSAPVRWSAYTNMVTPIRFQLTSVQASSSNTLSEVASCTVFVRERGMSVPGFEVPAIAIAVAFMMMSRLASGRRTR